MCAVLAASAAVLAGCAKIDESPRAAEAEISPSASAENQVFVSPVYESLSNEEKVLYDTVKNAVINFEEFAEFEQPADRETVRKVYRLVYSQERIYFWLSSIFYAPDSEVSALRLNYLYEKEDAELKRAELDFAASTIKKEYKSNSDTVIQWHHFPVINASFDKMVEDSQKKQGINETFMGIYEIPPLTQEDCDMLKEYIKTADIVQNHYYNSEVSKICNEEVQAFFAGEQTSDETADYIQNRVSIMLSEQS